MPIANFLTEGMTMTHSASLRRSVGRLSGISRISLRTSPQFWRRSTSFLLLATAAETQAKAAMQSAGMTFFIRTALGARASVIVVLPDNDARPNNRDRDVDAVRERIQNVIQIVAAEVDVFSALWPEDGDFRAVVRDEEDIDALRVVFPVMMLALFIVLMVVVTTALDNDGVGLDDLVSGLIARHGRRGGLEPR